MKKIIRLTESDLTRIVRRVIREQDRSKMLGDAGISPEEYFMDMKTNRNQTIRFQTWVKKNYPQTNLGNSGPRRDGVDGVCGKLTTAAFYKYGEEFVMEVINKKGNDNNNDNGAIPNFSFKDCESLSKVDDPDALGSSPVIRIPGNVKVEYFTDGGPKYDSLKFYSNGKPFCSISTNRFNKIDCEHKFKPQSIMAPGDSPMVMLNNVELSHFIDGGPNYEKWTIKNDGRYFCGIGR
jgi:hypothetical protein